MGSIKITRVFVKVALFVIFGWLWFTIARIVYFDQGGLYAIAWAAAALATAIFFYKLSMKDDGE